MKLQSKLPSLGTTIFSQMSQLASECQAINLSQGFPDFPSNPRLIELLAESAAQGLNQYAAMPGVLELRQQISALVLRHYQRNLSAEQQITVTSGATEALFVAIQALVRAGDEVIVFDPAYDSYQPAVELAGGFTVHVPLLPPLYQVDWVQLEKQISKKTRLIIVNSPHNPTGAVFSHQDWLSLQALVLKHRLFCISDEVYEHLVFDGQPHHSANQYPELAERTVIVSSFGKTFHVTGWKLGYAVAPVELTTEFRKIHQYVTFSSFTPAQHAIAQFMMEQPEQVSGLAAFYQQKRDQFRQGLAGSAWSLLPCRGSYFQLADYSAFSDLDDVAFCQWLTREHKVAAIPLSVFYRQPPSQRIIRFCFAKQPQTLALATEILCQLSVLR
jgi:methionine transaminase